MATRRPRGDRKAVLCRVFAVVFAVAAVWSAILTLSGGFDFSIGSIRVRSNNPRNPALIAMASALVLWVISWSANGRTALHDEWECWQRRYQSTNEWRARWRPMFDYALSPFAVAAIGIALDVSQWAAALPLWVDEEMIALNVRDRSFADLDGMLWLGQSAPLGWLALERSVMLVLGGGERALRLVPLLFGVATVLTAAWIGRRWMGRVGAVVFVLLCWVSRQLAHYRFEFKHYTADVFFGLAIPALAAWVVEADNARDRTRRALIWWAVAALGQWFANGALLVAPACAVFLFVFLLRQDGVRRVFYFSAAWLVWLVSFGLHYDLSLQYTHHNEYLREYWAAQMLPASAGLSDSLRWFIDRLEPLALNPAGTALWASLWISAIGGLLAANRRRLGLAFAGVPPSAFAFAAVVPLIERHSIWIVPALYAGIALLIDRAMDLATGAFARRRWALLMLASTILFAEFRLCASIYEYGKAELDARRHATHKHRLDDRAAIRWLMSQRQPGDVVMTMGLALPAVWWYGDIRITDEAGFGSALPDGTPIYEVGHSFECPSRQLETALQHRGRVLLYLGVEVNANFEEVLLRELSQTGDLTTHRQFETLSKAAVLNLEAPPSDRVMQLRRTSSGELPSVSGCVSVKPARRW